MGVVEVPLLLWFRFLTFFLPVYFVKIYDSFIIPPTHPKQPHRRILFFWEVLRAPNHPHTLLTFDPIHSVYLSQCFALDYVSFIPFSLSHHPLNMSGEGAWGEVGAGAEVEEE